LLIERLSFDMSDLGGQLALTARHDVTLRDVVSAGTSLLNRSPEGGAVLRENVCCGALRVAGPSKVYACQLITEGAATTRNTNDASPPMILGLKTEGDASCRTTANGSHSAILGGLVYVVRDAGLKIPT